MWWTRPGMLIKTKDVAYNEDGQSDAKGKLRIWSRQIKSQLFKLNTRHPVIEGFRRLATEVTLLQGRGINFFFFWTPEQVQLPQHYPCTLR